MQYMHLFFQVHGYKDSWQDFYGTLVMISTENATKYSASVTSVIRLVNESKSSILCIAPA